MLATVIALAANLVPLAGVWYWGWDAFQVLIIYWAETVVIGGWALMRIATLPPQYLGSITINGREQAGTNKTMTWFFAANAGASSSSICSFCVSCSSRSGQARCKTQPVSSPSISAMPACGR